MIHYDVICGTGHKFDGWFPSSTGFEIQSKQGLIACPICADTKITRALMAPSVPRKGNAIAPVPQEPALLALPAAGGVLPDSVRTAMRHMRQLVEVHCDHVGTNFAEEARRIHYGEAAPRGIYGESTAEEAEALADEGIEIAQIPWIKDDS